eukprot:7383014-Prymnesium_polylepis.1
MVRSDAPPSSSSSAAGPAAVPPRDAIGRPLLPVSGRPELPVKGREEASDELGRKSAEPGREPNDAVEPRAVVD